MARRSKKTYDSDINIAGDLEEILGGVLQGMTGEEKGKLVYFAMKTVMSKQSRVVRQQVMNSRLKIRPDQLKDAVWSWANGWAGAAGVKIRPGKQRKKTKGQVPIKRVPGWRLPILLWTAEGTKPHVATKYGKTISIDKDKYRFLRNKEILERQAMAALPAEVNRRVDKWLKEKLNY